MLILDSIQHWIVFLGTVFGVVVISIKIPKAISEWIVAKAEREKEIVAALKQLSPNGGGSLMDKVNKLIVDFAQHVRESEADREVLVELVKATNLNENSAAIDRLLHKKEN